MKSVYRRAPQVCVMITDWAGDQHFYGPFKGQNTAERWLRAHVSKDLENEVNIDGMGRCVWTINALRGPKSGL